MPLTFFPAKKVSKKALRAVEQLATASSWVFLPFPLKMQNSLMLKQLHFLNAGREEKRSCSKPGTLSQGIVFDFD
jgi:hypothetical protein